MKKTTAAYKQGMESGLEDWCLTGTPHRTRECPLKDFDHRIQWQLGRCRGFMEAEELLSHRLDNSGEEQ